MPKAKATSSAASAATKRKRGEKAEDPTETEPSSLEASPEPQAADQADEAPAPKRRKDTAPKADDATADKPKTAADKAKSASAAKAKTTKGKAGGETEAKTGAPRRDGRKREEGAPKRPMSGYFLWMGEERERLKGEAGAGSGVSGLAKLAGEQWRALSEEDKAPWQQKAKDAKAQYDVDLKAFHDAKASA